MASIRENKKNGKVVSYTFTACFGRDPAGKQIRQYINWTPPPGMTPGKAKKEAEKQAILWEERLKETQEEKKTPVERLTIDEEHKDDFVKFIDEYWLPIVKGSDGRQKNTCESA